MLEIVLYFPVLHATDVQLLLKKRFVTCKKEKLGLKFKLMRMGEKIEDIISFHKSACVYTTSMVYFPSQSPGKEGSVKCSPRPLLYPVYPCQVALIQTRDAKCEAQCDEEYDRHYDEECDVPYGCHMLSL